MTTATRTLQLKAAPLIVEAEKEKKPVKVRITAYTGGIMTVPGWGPVIIDLQGLDLPQRVTLLLDHEGRTEATIGWGIPKTDGKTLVIDGTVTEATDAGKLVIALLKDDVPLQASVGVETNQYRPLKPGDTITVNGQTITVESDTFLIEGGILREVSVVPLGADKQTMVTLAAGVRNMTHQPAPPENSSPGETIEAKYILDLLSVCGDDMSTFRQAIENRLPLETAKALAETRRRPVIPPVLNAEVKDTPASILAAAALKLLGKESLAEKELGAETLSAAASYKPRTALDLCGMACQMSLGYAPRGTNEIIRAAFSTTDLPVALGVAANKIALDAYQQAPATWKSFARIVSAKDFKEHTGIRLTGDFKLEELAAHGEIRHANVGEETITYKVTTYAKMLMLDRQHIINDDIAILDQIPTIFGRAAARKVADLVYTVLLSNPGGFFSAAHSNLITGAESGLSVASLAEAIAALRKQTDADGLPLDLVPRVLLVPPELEATARQVLNSVELYRSGGDQLPAGNPFAGLNIALEVEPRLSNTYFPGNSTTAWYLLCGPADGSFLVAFLNGQQGPTIEPVDPGADKLGTGWRCYIDIGAAAADWRCAVKASGA